MEIVGGMIVGIILLYLIIYVIAMAWSVLVYVLQSLGVMGMMKSFGMPHPGTAFIPFYNVFLIGRLAEKSSANNGDKKVKPFSKILLILMIAMVVISILYVCVGGAVSFVAGLESATDEIVNGSADGAVTEDAVTLDSLTPVDIVMIVVVAVTYLLDMAVAITYSVFLYMAWYKIYKCFAPSRAVAYLLLSILVNVTQPFIIFSLRNKTPVSPEPPTYEGTAEETLE